MSADAVLDIDVSLDIGSLRLRVARSSPSRRLAIVGPSGAGKSTLLRVLAGLEPNAVGRVVFRGETWHEVAGGCRVPPHRRRVGWVPQDVRLFPHKSVRANLLFGGGTDAEARALAERFGVETLLDRRPRHLSGGEAQRVALARALLARPRLLLLDEPFAALDRARRNDVADALRDVTTASDIAVILVTHDERDVASLAEDVFEMADGRIATASPGHERAPAKDGITGGEPPVG